MNLDRYWKKVAKSPGCWEWTAALHGSGYGIFGVGGKRVDRAHRISWQLHFGEIPDGLFVCHRCDNRRCVNPDHLFLGTNRDNVRDCIRKGRNSTPPAMAGWNRIELPQEAIDRLGTESDRALGAEFGVSKYKIQRARAAKGIESWSSKNGDPTQFKSGHPHPRWSRKEVQK